MNRWEKDKRLFPDKDALDNDLSREDIGDAFKQQKFVSWELNWLHMLHQYILNSIRTNLCDKLD